MGQCTIDLLESFRCDPYTTKEDIAPQLKGRQLGNDKFYFLMRCETNLFSVFTLHTVPMNSHLVLRTYLVIM